MKKVKVFIIYFPIVLVGCQVILNLLSLVLPELYLAAGFYLNTFFGTNVLFAVFLVAFTWMFNFCAISRWSAVAEILFAINYLIVQEDNTYNIVFQIIVGILALLLTARYYTSRFPFCTVSLIYRFIRNAFREKSCTKGLHRFDRDIDHILTHKRPVHARR